MTVPDEAVEAAEFEVRKLRAEKEHIDAIIRRLLQVIRKGFTNEHQ